MIGHGLGAGRLRQGTHRDALLLGQRRERLRQDGRVHRAGLERGDHVGERHELHLHVLDREPVAAKRQVEHPLHGGAADVERHRASLEVGDALDLLAPESLAHDEVVLDVARVERRDVLDGQPGDDRVEAGGAHAGAAELQLAGRHLGDDLGAAGEPHGLDVDARPPAGGGRRAGTARRTNPSGCSRS